MNTIEIKVAGASCSRQIVDKPPKSLSGNADFECRLPHKHRCQRGRWRSQENLHSKKRSVQLCQQSAARSENAPYLTPNSVGAGFKPALRSDNTTAGRFETCPYEISP